MKIVEIKATDKIDECWDLLQAHREELATHKNLMILKPDIQKYKILEDKNALFTLALYDEDKIVGYSVNVLTNNLHYSDLIMAQNDLLFLRKDLRKGRHGLSLIRATEVAAAARGAKYIIFHAKPGTAFSDIMPKLGYGIQDIMFGRVLENTENP